MEEQAEVVKQLRKIFDIFLASKGDIRPHFILTGPSGSGKSHSVQFLTEEYDVNYFEINAAQLTKEGTSGNSLSKALSPLLNAGDRLTVCFVDEFDKLFISGNSNNQLAHETTNGVQNEFLKVLESKYTSVYGDFGKYIEAPVEKTLFIFAGAFNGEEISDIDRLRAFGIKTEFLGRVGLVYSMKKLSLKSIEGILKSSPLLSKYLKLFPKVEKETVISSVMVAITEAYEKNTLGVRLINTLLNKFFISGGKLGEKEIKETSFQKTLELDEGLEAL